MSDQAIRSNELQLAMTASSHGTRRWARFVLRHERQQYGISARQQRRRRTEKYRAAKPSGPNVYTDRPSMHTRNLLRGVAELEKQLQRATLKLLSGELV